MDTMPTDSSADPCKVETEPQSTGFKVSGTAAEVSVRWHCLLLSYLLSTNECLHAYWSLLFEAAYCTVGCAKRFPRKGEVLLGN